MKLYSILFFAAIQLGANLSFACADFDGDGYGFGGDETCPNGPAPDCDNFNERVWALAPEVHNIQVRKDTVIPSEVIVTWDPIDPKFQGGLDPITYEVVSTINPDSSVPDTNPRPDWEVPDRVCEESGLTTTESSPLAIFPGNSLILVRAVNACGPGPSGADSTGIPRAVTGCE